MCALMVSDSRLRINKVGYDAPPPSKVLAV